MDTTTIIVGTFVIIALIWILKDSEGFKTATKAISDLFTTGVGALTPKQ